MINHSRQRFQWRRCLRMVLLVLVIGFVALNLVAARQVYALTHFVPAGASLEQQLAVPLPQKLWTLLHGVRLPRPMNHATPDEYGLPYEVRIIPLDPQQYLEAWYIPHPELRGIIIMFAGYAGVKESLLAPAAHFYQWEYSSLLVDFRGTGGSTGNDTTLGIREAEDVVVAFTYAQEQWPGQPVMGYGVSMGAVALMRAVARHDLQLGALILEGPFDRLSTTVRHRFDAVGVPSFPAADLLLLWGSIQVGANAFAHNLLEYAADITCPTPLLRGEYDPWITAEEMQALAMAFPGKADLVTIPKRGHEMPFVSTAPEVWVQAVRAFLDAAHATFSASGMLSVPPKIRHA